MFRAPTTLAPTSPATSDLPEYLTLHEIVKKARQKLSHDDWDYIIGGTETEVGVKRNRLAIDSLGFRPRILRDVSRIDAGTTFLGKRLRLPIVLAPVGSLELFSPDGAVGSVRAAHTFGVAHMLSSVCQPGIEALAEASPQALRTYQLYVHGDAGWIDDRIERCIAAGYSAFCFTVDSAVYSRRERDQAKRNIRRSVVPGREMQVFFSWRDIERIRAKYSIPIILKGVDTADDARMAIDHGVDMIYVSNHGGRQLDHCLGSMAILPEIVDAVQKRVPVIVDGGFNRGSDVVKAMAAGADMVGMGRMQCLGLAAGGEAGVVRMLEILEHEIVTCMGLLGVNNWSELDRSYISAAPAIDTPHTLSAFPLLSLEEKSFY
jgi:isopentenyl diphosphate isomerase/L-lactate dehydrogenase-like FMN-dependent dehydrogenase